MSAHDYFAASTDGFEPGFPKAGEAAIAHDWNTSDDSQFLPFALSRSRWAQWMKQIARHGVILNVADPLDYNLTFAFNMSRFMMTGALATEASIRKPGIAASFGNESPDGPFKFTGTQIQEGFDDEEDNVAEANLTLYLGSKQKIGINLENQVTVPHLKVDSLGSWYPSFLVEGSISFQAASDFVYTFRSYVHPDEVVGPDLTVEGSFAAAHGGGVFPLRVFSDSGFEAEGASLIITPDLWYSWDGKWDTATGAANFYRRHREEAARCKARKDLRRDRSAPVDEP